jgi:glutamate racemase
MNPDTLVLGCTHYPLLRPLIERVVPAGMRVIDSAEAAAEAAALLFNNPPHDDGTPCPILSASFAERVGNDEPPANADPPLTEIRCFATDSVEKFERLGSRFLNQPTGKVELIDLGG